MDDISSKDMELLVEMGYSENSAKKALLLSRGGTVNDAVSWLADHEADPDIDAPISEQDLERSQSYALGVASSSTSGCPVVGVPSLSGSLPVVVHPDGEEAAAFVIGVSGECKVVLVVPKELQMSPGKLGSQCAHASIGIYRLMITNQVPWLTAWEAQGEKMVVLGVESSADLEELMEHALTKTLLVHTVNDAGLTEVEPGALTVLAIGGLAEVVDEVTGHLSTY